MSFCAWKQKHQVTKWKHQKWTGQAWSGAGHRARLDNAKRRHRPIETESKLEITKMSSKWWYENERPTRTKNKKKFELEERKRSKKKNDGTWLKKSIGQTNNKTRMRMIKMMRCEQENEIRVKWPSYESNKRRHVTIDNKRPKAEWKRVKMGQLGPDEPNLLRSTRSNEAKSRNFDFSF